MNGLEEGRRSRRISRTAKDPVTGRLYHRIRKRKRRREVSSFLKSLRTRRPGEKLYVIADNYSPHKHPEVQEWAADNDFGSRGP